MDIIQQALQLVKSYHPEVTQVHFDEDLAWVYSDDQGNAPEFVEVLIGHDLLEAAQDAADTCTTYHLVV